MAYRSRQRIVVRLDLPSARIAYPLIAYFENTVGRIHMNVTPFDFDTFVQSFKDTGVFDAVSIEMCRNCLDYILLGVRCDDLTLTKHMSHHRHLCPPLWV
jgi:hypothetical protein